MISKNALFLIALGAPLALALPAACTAADGSSSFGGDTGGSDGSGADSSSGNGTGGIDLSSGAGTGGNDAPCLAEEAQAEPIQLDMVVVVDRSGSMINAGYWNPTVNALKAFFDDPSSGGVHVALNLFPNPTTGNDCNPNNWNPPLVPNGGGLAELPMDAATLKGALDTYPSVSGQLTPMYGALDGSYQFAIAHQTANPNNKVIVVLAGDGNPEGGYCQTHYGSSTAESIGGCANLASNAFNNNGIETYAVSISSNVLAAMDQIAAVGGTTQAFDVSSNISAFTQKMQEIRDNALGCEYLIPENSGEEFDPFKVNVIYTPGDGSGEVTIPQADNAADCGSGDGWYYDDPDNPTRIMLCPATCDKVTNDPTANVQLAFGCPTEIN